MFDMAKSSYLMDKLVAELSREGEEAIHDAYYNRDWNNRTYNLHDSYGSAVYVNGKLVKSSIRYIGQELAKNGRNVGWVWNKGRSMPDYKGNRRLPGNEVEMRGREEVMDFFSHYTPKGKGIELVIVAAMFYANILEAGGGNLRHKYRVISSADSTMREIASKYHGKVEEISVTRDMSRMTTIKDKSWG